METPDAHSLPLPTIRRYPIFLRTIGEMMDAGEAYISSSVLAERLGLDPVLTRKDLAMAGVPGRPRRGYPAEALRVAWASSDESSKPDFAGFDFAESLVHGVISRKDELDAAIGKSSHNWRVDRMSRIDRNIIRIAAYELMQENPLPASIVLNEAIELAKRFGSVESRSFINGVLDCMVKASEGRQQKKD